MFERGKNKRALIINLIRLTIYVLSSFYKSNNIGGNGALVFVSFFFIQTWTVICSDRLFIYFAGGGRGLRI